MRYRLCLICVLIIASWCSGQTTETEAILARSEKYYSDAEIFAIQVETRRKTAINFDTSKHVIHFFVNQQKGQVVFMTDSSGKGMFISGKDQFDVDYSESMYRKIRPKDQKTFIYDGLYKAYVFNSTKDFFAMLKKKKLTTREADDEWILQEPGTEYSFRKSDYSLKAIRSWRYDNMNRGISFTETVFGKLEEDVAMVEEQISNAIRITSSESQFAAEAEPERPTKFDLRLLAGLVPDSVLSAEKIAGRYILIDFFFQGCYPCVLAYPKVDRILQEGNGQVIVVGIDTRPQDSLHIQEYAKKYRISYPVLAGARAYEISRLVGIRTWPTFLILDSDGIIIEYAEGNTDSFFAKVRRKYLK